MTQLTMFPEADKGTVKKFDHPGCSEKLTAMRMEADISPCGRYRWTLQRTWDEALPTALWIMLNPSTADHQRNDPTLLRVIHFSRSWGFGQATVVNLYPYRSPSPAECRRWAESDEVAGTAETNLGTIIAEAQDAEMIVAAWGAAGWAHDQALAIAGELWAFDETLQCLGVTADGSPKHPLARGHHRIPNDQKPIIWRT